MLVSHQERPRELKWFHAGPLLYGDLGTSRFYVLGLAFYYALYASIWYVLAVGLLVAAVGWAYTLICRSYPDGGGVYSAARQLSPTLAVVGALLLFADYAVTAALSSFDGMRYFGIENVQWVAVGACSAILVLGFINYVGPKKAGTLALAIALATVVATLVLSVFSIPHLATGWHNITAVHGTMTDKWDNLVKVVLALSGVEAVANMTGIMIHPVEITSRKAILPVLAEVIIFNVILGIAMLAITPSGNIKTNGDHDFAKPAYEYELQISDMKADIAEQAALAKRQPEIQQNVAILEAKLQQMPQVSKHENDVKDSVLRVMGEQFVGEALGPRIGDFWGRISGFIFGMLLISAVNTVLGGMISVQYVMSRDGELPRFFNKLNVFGVPWIGLIPAVGIPIALLSIFTRLEDLADLYAIGVVGAIAINLSCCTINLKLPIRRWERVAMGAIAAIMIAIELTLAVEKPPALIFALTILGAGLTMRYATRLYPKLKARYRPAVATAGVPGAVAAPGETGEIDLAALTSPPSELDMSKPHIMVATRGGQRLIEFSANYAKRAEGILFVIYVRQLNVQFATDRTTMSLEEDAEARQTFRASADACRRVGVPMVPIYVVSPDVAYSLLDFAATYNVEALLMGVSRKGTLLRALQGDIITHVADNLPADIPLLIHA